MLDSNDEKNMKTLAWLPRKMRNLRFKIWKVSVVARFAITGDCGLSCGITEPYGFVPEAGCPIHDLAQNLNLMKHVQDWEGKGRA